MKRDIGIRLALAGLGTALSIVFIVLAYYIKNLSLSLNILASVGIMLPLTKGYYREGLLSAIASCVIGFFIVNISILSFVLASSFYVVFTILWNNKKWNKILGYGIKLAYSFFVFYILYQVVNLITIDFTLLPQMANLPVIYLYLIMNIVFSIAFIVYDFVAVQVFLYLQKIINKTIKNK